MVYPQQAYERIFENATFTFFGAFSTIEDFVMKQEIELLHTICETEGFEWFKTAIRMSKPRAKKVEEPTKPEKDVESAKGQPENTNPSNMNSEAKLVNHDNRNYSQN